MAAKTISGVAEIQPTSKTPVSFKRKQKMPSYSYHCDGCGQDLEVLKQMTDADTVEFCPGDNCDFLPMHRLYDSAPAAKIVGGTPRFHHRKPAQHDG